MSTTSRPRSLRRRTKSGAAKRKNHSKSANRWLQALQNHFLPRWLPHADWIIALLYLGAFWLLALPFIRIGYDNMNQTNLLMSSLRILDGQIPFRDFYPWYGPLFHYFVAFWVWLLGRNLLAAKLFIRVISPLLSMAMLLATLRLFRLEAWGRFFVVTASIWWIFETNFEIGATRTFFGLFLIGLWIAGLHQPQRAWARALVFPSSLLAFSYSPEIGIYLLPVILTIAGFDLLELPSLRRKNAWLAYGAGALITIGLFAAFYLVFDWFRNYVHFFLYTSSNMIWAYSLPLPELDEFFSSPRQWLHLPHWPVLSLAGEKAASLGKLLFFLPWPVLAITLGWLLIMIRRGKISQIPVWIPACVAYGAMLWTTTYLRTDGGHLLWALPPILILMGKLFSRRSRGGLIQIGLLSLILWGWPFFLYAPPDFSFRTASAQKTKAWTNWLKFSGVQVPPAESEMVKSLQAFIQAHPQDTILFPLHGFEAYRLGQSFRLPFDDLFWASFPERQAKLSNLMQSLNASYICLDQNFFFYVYMHEDVDALFDYIATHYHFIRQFHSSVLYERLPEPRVLAREIQSLPGPILLSNRNSFQTEWELPDGFSGGYIEMHESFSYPSRWLQRFSRPLVMVLLNDLPIKRTITDGPGRIRNTAGGGTYRIFIPHNVKKVKLQILYPGVLNLKPEAVTLKQIGFYEFNFWPNVPYTADFLNNGY